MILGRSSKPRSRASIACAGCRARRTKCIIGDGQNACDRCIRLSKTCVLRDDDERKRPVTKAQVHALVRRIGALEQRLSDAGLEIPPTLADDAAQQHDDSSHNTPQQQRRTSMREDVAAAVQGSVVTAAALVAAATGHGRGAMAPAMALRGDGGGGDSTSPPQQHQPNGASGTTPSSTGAGSMWPPPPPLLPPTPSFDRDRGTAGNGNGVMLMDETDSPASTAVSSSSDMASSSAVYPGEAERRRRLRAGSMSLGGPGGHSRYIGVTTNYHIYSNMYHAEKEETRRERESNAARTRALLAGIPYEAHQHLLQQFWTCYNTIIHIVHRKAFELDGGIARDSDGSGGDGIDMSAGTAGMGTGTGTGSFYSPFLHVCMLAVGYRYADRTKPDIQAFATPEGGSLLHEEAKRLVDHELQMPGGIPSLQALLLLGDLECGVGRYNTGWLYSGMACRLIFDLGLNRQCGQAGQSRLEAEVKRTVLWGCVVLDRFWGLFLGRPTSIKIADISVASSSSAADGPFSRARPMQGCLPMGARCRLETEIYEALIHLTDTASKLTDAAHRHYTTSDPSAYYFVTGLHRELRSWYRQLSGRLQWTPANLARGPPSAFFNLHQQYHTMFILMYRPFLSGGGGQTGGDGDTTIHRSPYGDDDGRVDDAAADDDEPELGSTDIVTEMARKTCFAHAIEVARIYEAFCARFECRTMFVTGMQHAATAAFAIVEGLATQSSGADRSGADRRQAATLLHLQRLAEALYAHASVYYPARVMSNILFRVLGEYRDSAAQRQQLQQQQLHQQQHQNQNQQQHQHNNHHQHHQHHHSIDMTGASPSIPSPAWTAAATSSPAGMMQPPPVPTAHAVHPQHPATTTAPSSGDWTGLLDGTAVAGSGAGPGVGANGGFVDFEIDSGIWDSIMNTLSQPVDLGV